MTTTASEKQRAISLALGVNQHATEDYDATTNTVMHRSKFIQDALLKSGLKNLILGISGGVDSLTAGLICEHAISSLNSVSDKNEYALIGMRLPYGTQADEADASLAMGFIGPQEMLTVNIKSSVDAMGAAHQSAIWKESKSAKYNPEHTDFVRGNIKARMRMIAQYAVANECGGLVVGTDHAAEALFGFYTLHGDGACDIAPLSGLTKQQVRDIARWFTAPEHLINKVPTADLEDLSPGKPDELVFGCSYSDIERYLTLKSVPDNVRNTIETAYEKTQHKRQMPAVPLAK